MSSLSFTESVNKSIVNLKTEIERGKNAEIELERIVSSVLKSTGIVTVWYVTIAYTSGIPTRVHTLRGTFDAVRDHINGVMRTNVGSMIERASIVPPESHKIIDCP